MLKLLKCLSYDWKNNMVIRVVRREEGHISSVSFSLGILSLFNGICKALFMLFFIKAIGYFCCLMFLALTTVLVLWFLFCQQYRWIQTSMQKVGPSRFKPMTLCLPCTCSNGLMLNGLWDQVITKFKSWLGNCSS